MNVPPHGGDPQYLEALGASLENVIRTRIFVKDISQWEEIGRAHAEKFAEIMSEMLAAGYCDRFFLATDSAELERRFVERFGKSLVVHSKQSYDRSVETSIKEAVVDLYCLAACKRIIGSYWSSFSETAAQIGNKELLVVDTRAESNSHAASEGY